MSRRALTLSGMALLWLATLGSAVAAVWCKHTARTSFVELERLSDERDALEIEWGRLQLEQSAWSTHAFVERVAAEKLRMQIPEASDVVLVRAPEQ